MKYALALLFIVLTLPAHAMGPWKRDCQIEVPCELGERSYHVKEPDGWDGTTPLPVLIHFHGWQRTGALPVRHQRISGATRRRGVLLIAPNGQRKTWNMWSADTDDVAFAQAVLNDVARRYPVDPENVFLSGYSYGSIMAWRVACDRGARMNISALLGISGTLAQDEDCAEAPREVRHVHGLNDTVLNFPFGPDGSTTYPATLWRAALGCDDTRLGGTYKVVDFLEFDRTTWTGCAGGATVTLDTHPGGHFIPHGWIGRQLDELLGRRMTYP